MIIPRLLYSLRRRLAARLGIPTVQQFSGQVDSSPGGHYDATGALRRIRRPPSQGERGDYKHAWDAAASQVESAFAMVDGSPDEDALRASGDRVAQWLKRGLAIDPAHKVLEVGCGVGRIGRELAPLCGEWHGVDISANMIQIAAHRTSHLSNVHLQALPQSSQLPFPDATFDRIYSHIVLFHMDKEDMFEYLLEFGRVLKPEGLLYFDTWNLAHLFGWQRFLHEREMHAGVTPRPVNRNQFATPQEVSLYTKRAGLGLVALLTRSSLVQAVAVRPRPGERVSAARKRWERLSLAAGAVEPGSARLRVLPGPEQAILTIDAPIEGATLSGDVAFSGWALHPQEVDDPAWGEVAVFCVSLSLQREGELPIELGYAAHNLPRPDVASALGQPRFRNVGWTFAWNSCEVDNGEYKLWVEAHLTCGYMQKSLVVLVEN